MRIAIVGAGPARLTAALALRRLGLEVTVFE
jgi:2-polyprenyl-6-methoxyphenol hydroxylase-like FAD-dependent oxidoreductase